MLAVMLEWRYDKRQILEAYLNAIYFGQHGAAAIYGVGAAANSYFGKHVGELSIGEAALLAGMIRAPNSYSLVHSPARARERRDVVLRQMHELGFIDATAFADASGERLRTRRAALAGFLGPYFLDYVRVSLERGHGDSGLARGGLHVYTSLDPILQRAAEAALARGLDHLEGHYAHLRRRNATERLQGVLLALDPATGEIRAMVGGRDYALSQFNRATYAHRQPGSAFKPFVYLAALRREPHGELPRVTLASLVEDAPLSLQVGPDRWAPRNYNDRYAGVVTVRKALEQSLNTATVRLAQAVGLDRVIQTARDVGLTSPMMAVPSLSLGAFEVTPLELAAAYAAVANGGQRVTPTAVRAVASSDGWPDARTVTRLVTAVRPDEAYLLTRLLRGVVDRGTGETVRELGVQGPVAGKTGTTNDGRDAWFVGYTPRLVALVWVGFDEHDFVRLSGGQAALPIWADFMRAATAAVPGGPFAVPTSIVFVDVDPTTGARATPSCPVVVREAFLPSTEPAEFCPDHRPAGAFESFFRRLRDLVQRPGPRPPPPPDLDDTR